MKYKNPILPGMHPDPSICRVGKDYYLVNSSFGFFPEIPIYHSRDLIHWAQIGYCLDEKNAVTLRAGRPDSTGIFAPTIRFHDGIFYVIATNVAYGEADEGNFLIYSADPEQGWSQPIHLATPGIDPSLFFDEDGKSYYTGAADGHIIFCEIDVKTGAILSDVKMLWEGTGGSDPEGPHLYKKDGWYYLMISEGGTEYCHMITAARSRSIEGPYEACDRNPLLTNRSLSTPIKAVGHGDLFCDHNGNWWIVCLGIRPITYPFKHNLGRETMLAPVVWEQGAFPVCGADGRLEEWIETDLLPQEQGFLESQQQNIAGCTDFYDDFSGSSLSLCWNTLYRMDPSLIALSPSREGLFLTGNREALTSQKPLSLLGRRQEHHIFRARTKIHFCPEKDGEEAGLTLYMNHLHHYEIALTCLNGENSLIFRRQIGSLYRIEQQIPLPDTTLFLEISATEEWYCFSYSIDGETYHPFGKGECAYLTTEVGGYFAGNYIALYASGNGTNCTKPARIFWFHYLADRKDKSL